MPRKKISKMNPNMWRNYCSSDDDYYEWYKHRLDETIMDAHLETYEEPILKAQILNGLFEQDTSGDTVTPESVKMDGNRKVFHIRFIETAEDGRHKFTPTSHLSDPADWKDAAMRSATVLRHPLAYPSKPDEAENQEFSAGDIIEVFWRGGRWVYTVSGDKFNEKEWMKKIWKLMGNNVTPQNAFANAGKDISSLQQDPHFLNMSNTNKRERKIGEVDHIVLHYSAGGTLEEAIDALNSEKPYLAYHYLIDYDGKVTTFHPEKMAAAHDLNNNARTIGVSFINIGYARTLPNGISDPVESTKAWLSKRGVPSEALEMVGPAKLGSSGAHTPRGNAKYWPAYPKAQWESGAKLVAQIMSRWEIDPKNIYTHSYTDPGKSDTGPAFPLEEFKRRVSAQYTGPRAESNTSSGGMGGGTSGGGGAGSSY